jgi:AraC-like DNA-binding protein
LRITSVSDSLKTNRTYISRLINDEFGVNFNEFVNKYRIEEAKKLLESNESKLFTMEHIAEKSGFGSVNSFTRVFKEFEGITPGQFKNKSI